jgi:starch synthase
MANPTRILFVSDEVAPFTEGSEIADLVRALPEQLQETGDYEVRIMMPRYGVISERRNRLHEVIRLSGTSVAMGERAETLKVKVASIPGIRLQVYFMDNNHYFKRKGIYREKQGKAFEDNLDRAIFFGRSALETIKNLGWAPEVIHGFGWMSGLLPMLLRTEFGHLPLFASTRCLFTPGSSQVENRFTNEIVKKLRLPDGERLVGRSPIDLGLAFADVSLFPPSMAPTVADALQFSPVPEEATRQAAESYEQLLSEVPV